MSVGPFDNPMSADTIRALHADTDLRIESLRQAVAVVNQVDESIVESAETFYAFLTSSPSGEDK